MGGYSQAEKLADIPFPFMFAQILVVAPFAITLLTGDTVLAPIISVVVVLNFWALNEMAKELENPFGVEANNVPIVDHHERFITFLGEMHGSCLPRDRPF